jgi:hypothetical protein
MRGHLAGVNIDVAAELDIGQCAAVEPGAGGFGLRGSNRSFKRNLPQADAEVGLHDEETLLTDDGAEVQGRHGALEVIDAVAEPNFDPRPVGARLDLPVALGITL